MVTVGEHYRPHGPTFGIEELVNGLTLLYCYEANWMNCQL